MNRLELVNSCATEILGWRFCGLYWGASVYRVALVVQDKYPEHFRPDVHFLHSQIVVKAICQKWDATYKYSSLQAKKFEVVFQNETFKTYEREIWELRRTNIAICKAALEFHRANVAHEKENQN